MRRTGVCLWAMFLAGAASAQKPSAAAPGVVPAILLSDLHFDPFFDPGKFAQLQSAPASAWRAILAAPATPAQAAEYTRVSTACKLVRGVDTSWPLLESSFAAAKAASPHAAFVTVSGDLLAHEFDCRFKVLAPKASETAFATFAEKTVAYVALELHRTFPHTPVYVALGNNDSGCGDYRESAHSEFLRNAEESLAGDVISTTDKKALATFSDQGDYSVAMPAPVERGRLLVLQDIFQARTYKDCSGNLNPAGPAAQLQWLRGELAAARTAHEQVWVMAHIPPGVDVYNTFAHKTNVCAGDAPVMFLANPKMVDVLEEFADVVRLAMFAHTHLDEMRLLRGKVAAKLVPSISPINGNQPAFTLAEIDEPTAALKDYRVIAANNRTGVATTWAEEYRFSSLYRAKTYGPAEVGKLLDGFLADTQGVAQTSTDYQQNGSAGGGKGALAMHFLWPMYACETVADTEQAFRACMCRQTDAAKPQ